MKNIVEVFEISALNARPVKKRSTLFEKVLIIRG